MVITGRLLILQEYDKLTMLLKIKALNDRSKKRYWPISLYLFWMPQDHFTKDEKNFYQSCIDKHKDKIILVRNKIDEALDNSATFGQTCIDCSCKTKQNIDTIEKTIAAKIAALFDTINAPFLLNERQAHLLLTLEQKLGFIESMTHEPIQYELLSTHIKDALTLTSQLTGKTISEQTMDRIFKQFCVGK